MARKLPLHIEKNPSKVKYRQVSLDCSKYSCAVWGLVHPKGTFCKFYSHLVLETVPPVLQLTQNCYINTNISFSRKLEISTQIESCKNILCLKDYPRNLTKYEIKGSSKIQISQLCSELGNIWKYKLCLYWKSQIIHIFRKLRKIDQSIKSNIQKFQNLFVNWGTLRSTAYDQHPKIRIFKLWIYWEKLCTNLSFTVESKIGNLHRIKLLTFET